ncbi:MAG: CoA ester lyase [Burkholderiaceae bacterium]
MSFAPRSMLFVSAEKPDRFDKAIRSGADMVCIDLEDAVHPDNKPAAREAVVNYLLAADLSKHDVTVGVRVNGVSTPDGLRDFVHLADSGCRVDVVMMPKVVSVTEIRLAQTWLAKTCSHLVALIESPAGIEQAHEIASANLSAHGGGANRGPRLSALLLGGVDLSAELGASLSWHGLLSARGRLVNAAKSAGIQVWDVPCLDIHDAEGIEKETRAVREMGFDCKTAIHPAQIAPIHEAFKPSEHELEWAKGVVAAGEQAGHGQNSSQAAGAFLFNGKMIDEPVLKHAQQLLVQAARSSE